MKNSVKKALTLGAVALASLAFYSPGIVALAINRQAKEIGEGFSYVDMPLTHTRRFYDEEKRRVYFDNTKSGRLDEVAVNMPVSPFMGGPGYRLCSTSITDEDRIRFERAEYLLTNKGRNP